jgi:hypothetical protein
MDALHSVDALIVVRRRPYSLFSRAQNALAIERAIERVLERHLVS